MSAVRSQEESACCGRDGVPALVCRRPLFDGTLRVRAWELLVAGGVDAAARADVFWDELLELGVEGLTAGRSALLLVDRAFVLGEEALSFRGDHLDFAVSVERPVDAAFILGLRNLRALGHSIALAGWHPSDERALLDLTEEVRIDVSAPDGLEALARSVVSLHDRGIRVVATGIRGAADFERCRDLGADRFQGEVFDRPEGQPSRRIGIEAQGRLDLLGLINDPDATIDEFEHVVSADASLSYRLLKYVNSPLFALPTTVESTRHAVMLLGLRRARAWASLVVLAGSGGEPSVVLHAALIRARMCEDLARRIGFRPTETCFTAGLLSVLDVLLERPMDELVAELPLGDELSAALLRREGTPGRLLESAICYERGLWSAAAVDGVGARDLRDAYLDALRFALRIRRVGES